MHGVRRRQIAPPPESNSSALPLLNLSLFLMLLAFFIVLNGISSFEEARFHPIIKNLQMTFSSAVLQEGEAPSVTPSNIKSIHEGQTLDRIDALFNAQITGFEATQSVSSGGMQVDMTLEEFDRAMTMVGQVDLTKTKTVTGLQTYFVPTLVSLLHEAEAGRPYRLNIFMHTRDNPALLFNSDPAALKDTMRRAASYANILEKAGLTQPLINIGIMQGDPQKVTLSFRRHMRYMPADRGNAP